MGLHRRVAAPTFTRPANTTQYTAGDLVANDATAGNVVPLAFDVGQLIQGKITGGTLRKSTNATTAATFRLHLFTVTKAVTNGDNGALAIADYSGYIGSLSFDMSSGAVGIAGGPLDKPATAPGTPLSYMRANGGTLYGLLEATGTYTPASAETFTAILNMEQ